MLVDTGVARSAARIGAAIRDLGRAPGDVRAIVVTHLHRDHTGTLAEVKSRTGAEVWMHPADAALVREGVFVRPLEPGRALCGAPSRASATGGRRLRVGGRGELHGDDVIAGRRRDRVAPVSGRTFVLVGGVAA